MSERRRERSMTGDGDDSDFDSHAGDDHPGKPGRKKNPNSQAARRDQNRIAQREFRLRKQQRIRDLEARVELLSGTTDEAVGELRNILRDLMEENQTLRGLIRSLSSFIGEGAGGLLPKMGWNLQDFNEYVNKGETDTAWESYQRRRKTSTLNGDSEASSFAKTTGQKRSADQSEPPSSKRPRNGDKDVDSRSSYTMMPPMNTNLPPPQGPPLYPLGNRQNGMYNNNASPIFASPNTSYPSGPSGIDGYSRQYLPPVNIGMDQSPPMYNSPTSAPPSGSGHQRAVSNGGDESRDDEDDEDPKKSEAYKLINYHLENYKRNSQYCLPSSLRPTIVQRTIPHESVIDRVLFPELRDRMILLRQRYELVDCLMDMRGSVTIHGDDVLAHANWELGEEFVQKYSVLIDPPLLKIVNKWRRERGDPELHLPENSPSDDQL
ncbi:hypothetical protein CPB83DRAFT_843463 [Crepidotus variabilis]|uniref:BZIP domain-containing protein n=1 Tax=Crepidotus variabilis TaxID=179855 RepID=A0A9P6JW20_9AGAR|nr:hypothetical protein CPB83DRAFT_843463 [Crepidotus variabilis]